MSVLEAMACGLPCVIADSPLSATPTSPSPTSSSFEAGSREELTARIDRWIDDPAGLAEGARRLPGGVPALPGRGVGGQAGRALPAGHRRPRGGLAAPTT